MKLPPGTYKVSVDAPLHVPEEFRVTLRPGGTCEVRLLTSSLVE